MGDLISTGWAQIVSNIIIPIFLAVATAFVSIIGSYIKKATASIILKNAADSTLATITAKSNLINSLNTVVDAAVAKNMDMADKLKAVNDGKLSTEQIIELNESAKDMISQIIPFDNKDILNVVGGSDKLNILISGLIEKHVLDDKNDAKKNEVEVTPVG